MKYREQLKDDRWRRKREKIIQHADHRCQICGKEAPLDVHHSYYISGAMAWEYHDGALIAICRDCHAKIHDKNEPPKPIERKNDSEKIDDEYILTFLEGNQNSRISDFAEWVEATYGFSKSKTYRILDRLESRGLIEKDRIFISSPTTQAAVSRPHQEAIDAIWGRVVDGAGRCSPFLRGHLSLCKIQSFNKNVAVIKTPLSLLSLIDNSKTHCLLATKFGEIGHFGVQIKFLGI